MTDFARSIVLSDSSRGGVPSDLVMVLKVIREVKKDVILSKITCSFYNYLYFSTK